MLSLSCLIRWCLISTSGSIECSRFRTVSSSDRVHTSLCGSTFGQYFKHERIAWSASLSSFIMNLLMALMSDWRNWLRFLCRCIGSKQRSKICRCSDLSVSLNPSMMGTNRSRYSAMPKLRSFVDA